jgi:hypothetical protein
LFTINLPAQTRSRVVADSRTRLPIDFVFIHSANKQINILTDKDGKFIFIKDSLIKKMVFYKLGFEEKTLTVKNILDSDTIFLVRKLQTLEEVTVSAEKLVAVVKNKSFYVDDYIALSDHSFLLLTSRINGDGFNVVYQNSSGKIMHSIRIRGEAGGRLVKDCFGNFHVLTENFSRQIFFDSDSSFQFLSRYHRSRFDSTLALCAVKLDTTVVMRSPAVTTIVHTAVWDWTRNTEAISYYFVSKKRRQLFYTADYNQRNKEMIDNELRDWEDMPVTSIYAMSAQIGLFFRSIAGPLYVPVFAKKDTIMLFDFQRNAIVFMNTWGKTMKEVGMDSTLSHHMGTFEVLADEVRGEYYLVESDNQTILQINIHQGTANRTVHLEKAFAKRIQIVNRKLFYLIKEKGWDDTSYLYQQNE